MPFMPVLPCRCVRDLRLGGGRGELFQRVLAKLARYVPVDYRSTKVGEHDILCYCKVGEQGCWQGSTANGQFDIHCSIATSRRARIKGGALVFLVSGFHRNGVDTGHSLGVAANSVFQLCTYYGACMYVCTDIIRRWTNLFEKFFFPPSPPPYLMGRPQKEA